MLRVVSCSDVQIRSLVVYLVPKCYLTVAPSCNDRAILHQLSIALCNFYK